MSPNKKKGTLLFSYFMYNIVLATLSFLAHKFYNLIFTNLNIEKSFILIKKTHFTGQSPTNNITIKSPDVI